MSTDGRMGRQNMGDTYNGILSSLKGSEIPVHAMPQMDLEDTVLNVPSPFLAHPGTERRNKRGTYSTQQSTFYRQTLRAPQGLQLRLPLRNLVAGLANTPTEASETNVVLLSLLPVAGSASPETKLTLLLDSARLFCPSFPRPEAANSALSRDQAEAAGAGIRRGSGESQRPPSQRQLL